MRAYIIVVSLLANAAMAHPTFVALTQEPMPCTVTETDRRIMARYMELPTTKELLTKMAKLP